LKNIAFISTRIAGTDGVSLEIEKWAAILQRANYKIFYFAGELDRDESNSFLSPKAHFNHNEILEITKKSFSSKSRDGAISTSIEKIKNELKKDLYNFISKFKIDLIIPENILAIPMNIPLALAVTELIAETAIPTIAHHHDFFWERKRFLFNGVNDYLEKAFPPNLPSIKHVCINSIGAKQLSYRKGISFEIIPNIMDFSKATTANKKKIAYIKKEAELAPNDPFILQPTRIVPRKWIEKAIDLVASIEIKQPTLIISHKSGDEGDEYLRNLEQYAKIRNVKLKNLSYLIEKGFTLGDIYSSADIVTYPSDYEGFGNALLEAIYYKKPVIVNRYPVFITDIEPLGFDFIKIDGFITEKTIADTKKILVQKEKSLAITEKNFQIAKDNFSFKKASKKLLYLVDDFFIK